MLGEKAFNLIKELSRNEDSLPPYNTDLVNEISNEIRTLYEKNTICKNQLETTNDSRNNSVNMALLTTFRVQHSALERNRRCLLAYHYNRIRVLRTMRWEFGSILPPEIKANLSSSEIEWFSKYSRMLGQYMRGIGDDGVNLAIDLKPPKALYIEVRCLVDYGKFELNDGSVLLLKKDSRHYLPRSECEDLIRQGIIQHIL